jgi:hypothetical protein
MTRYLRFLLPLLSICLLTAGCFRIGSVWFVVGLLLFGWIWIVGLIFHWSWIPPLALFIAFGTAALGLYLDPSRGFRSNFSIGPYSLLGTSDPGHSVVFLLPAVLCALFSWDLAEFHIRLQKASPEDDLTRLEQRHLLRLAGLAITASALWLAALTQHFNPSFEWVVILMLCSVWGIRRMVNWLFGQES